jgi:hypothetical protein
MMVEFIIYGWIANFITVLIYIGFSAVMIINDSIYKLQKEMSSYNLNYKNDIQMLIELLIPYYGLMMFILCFYSYTSSNGNLRFKIQSCINNINKYKIFKVVKK